MENLDFSSTSSAALSARGIASSTLVGPNLTITESVSPYTTSALWENPLAIVYLLSTKVRVSKRRFLPYDVTEDAIIHITISFY